MKKNEFTSNIEMQSVSKREYPDLSVGDKVYIYIYIQQERCI